MAIKIIKTDDEYWLYTVTHCPVFIGEVLEDFGWSMKVGNIIPYDLKIDFEYEDLYFHKTKVGNIEHQDFVEVDRISMYGEVDIVTYVYKSHLNYYLRSKKLKRILCVQ